jgi:CO/xanthine dehydrogenase Mo-binding subunit
VFVAGDLTPLIHDYLVDDEAHAARPWPILAEGDVRCVGERIAMVLADSRYIAEDGVEATRRRCS